jgi:hypothetical protein
MTNDTGAAALGLAFSSFVAGMMFDAMMRTDGEWSVVFSGLFLANTAFVIVRLMRLKP